MVSAALTDAPCETATLRDYFSLLKPGVMTLVVFTGAVGMILAPGDMHPLLQIMTVLCIALGSGAGGAINMWYDSDIDAIMKRTSSRPVPAGRIAADDALVMGLGLSVLSVSLLGLVANWLAAGILGFAIFFYVVVYTMWLKRSTSQNIVIGGAAGAFPPVIGWAAVTGNVALEPLILFLIIFLWTPPHFWALALYRHDDYAKAKIPMLPVTAGERATKRQIVFYSILLVASSLLPWALASHGVVYLAIAIPAGIRFMYLALNVRQSSDPRDAMRLFGWSILYLFILFSGLLLDIALAPLLAIA